MKVLWFPILQIITVTSREVMVVLLQRVDATQIIHHSQALPFVTYHHEAFNSNQ